MLLTKICLQVELTASEAENADNEEIHTSILSYINGVQSSVGSDEKPPAVCRVLNTFPYSIKKGFIDLDKIAGRGRW